MKDGGATGGQLSKQRLRVWLSLLKVNRRIEAELRSRLRRQFATTLPRFDVMSVLFRHDDGLILSALSSMLMVSNGNITGIVERLVEDGLVLREPVPGDRRAAQVHLTDKGRAEFARQAKLHEAWVAELLGGLDWDDTEVTLETLSRIRLNEKENTDD